MTRARRPTRAIANTSRGAWKASRASARSRIRCSTTTSLSFSTRRFTLRTKWLASFAARIGRFHGEVPAHLYFQRADQHLLARSQRRRYGPLVHHLYQRGEKRRRSVSRGRILGQYLRAPSWRRLWKAASVTFNYKGIRARARRTSCPSRTTTGSSCAPSPALSPTACRAGRMRPVSCWWPLVGGALALVAGFLLVQTMRQRRKLLSESAHVTSIVNSSLALFQRFAVIDLVANTYEYLKDEGIKDDLPRNGEYHMFRYYWQTRFCDDEEAERMKTELAGAHSRASDAGHDVSALRVSPEGSRHGRGSLVAGLHAAAAARRLRPGDERAAFGAGCHRRERARDCEPQRAGRRVPRGRSAPAVPRPTSSIP